MTWRFRPATPDDGWTAMARTMKAHPTCQRAPFSYPVGQRGEGEAHTVGIQGYRLNRCDSPVARSFAATDLREMGTGQLITRHHCRG
jgi:hypothetical protein